MGVWGLDDLDHLEDETLRTGDHADTAERLARVADVGELAEISRAQVLVRAGEQWQIAGHTAAAAELYQRAVDDGGEVAGDARAYLADAYFELDREHEARKLIARIGEETPSDPVVYHCVAETLEARRELAEAHRWATTGVRVALADEQPAEVPLDLLLRARFRIRRDLGLPEDDYDHKLDP